MSISGQVPSRAPVAHGFQHFQRSSLLFHHRRAHQCQPCSCSPLHLVAMLTLAKLCPFLLFLHPCLHAVLTVCPLPCLPSQPPVTSALAGSQRRLLLLLKCSWQNLSPLTLLLGQPRSLAQLSAAPNDLCRLGPVFATCDPEGKAPGTGGAELLRGDVPAAGSSPWGSEEGWAGDTPSPLDLCLRALDCRLTTRTNLWVCVCACLSVSLPPA